MEKRELTSRSAENSRNNRQSTGSFLTLGMQLTLAVVVFFFIGYWLDQKWNTSPWLTLTGATIGAGGGMYKFIREAMKLSDQSDEDAKREAEEKHG
jgi:F0F1-type ATP synthase assembly protein I